MAIFVHTELQGNVDVNLTPDKRKVFLEKEAQIWDNLKENLKSMFLKIAPPVLVDQITTLNDFYNKVEEPTIKNEETEEKSYRKLSDNSVSSNGDCIRTRSPSSISNPVIFQHQKQNSYQKDIAKKYGEVSINASLELSDTQCSKIGKKVQFQKYKNTFFAISKMAKNQFLHQKKVENYQKCNFQLFSGAKIDFLPFLK